MTVEELALGFEKLLDGKKKVTIISHFNPDGDAVGSSVGLNWFLLERGYSSCIVLPSAAPPFLDFLDPEHSIIYYTEDKKRAKDAVNGCDLIVCLDFNKPGRTEWMSDLLTSAKADKVMIDHHPNAVREGFNIVISDEDASSTCELLFRVLMAFRHTGGRASSLSIKSLSAITAGILTDTNNFNNSVTPYTFNVAAEMLKAGVDFDFLNNMLPQQYAVQEILGIQDEADGTSAERVHGTGHRDSGFMYGAHNGGQKELWDSGRGFRRICQPSAYDRRHRNISVLQ